MRPVSAFIVPGALRRAFCIAALAATVLAGMNAARAANPTRLASPSAIAFVELSKPEVLLDRLTSPTLLDKVYALQAVKDYYAGPQYGQVRGVIGLVEAQLGKKWPQAVRDAFGGGVQLSFDPADNGALLVVKANDAAVLAKLDQAIRDLSALDPGNSQRALPPEEHLGVKIWRPAPEACYALFDELFVASNRLDTLQHAIERAKDPGQASLAEVAEFQAARLSVAQSPLAWGWARLETARMIPDLAKALQLPHDNPLGEVLIGGVLDAAGHADHLAASLHWETDKLTLRTMLPLDRSKVHDARKWFFTEEPSQAPLQLPQSIATFSFDRDVSGMWVARDELFVENVNTGLAQADATLGLFFSGRDFGPEVLGELGPQWRLVVAQQDYPEGTPIPALKVPAFAMVVKLNNPKEFSIEMLKGFQNVVGITNITGAMNGQPQFLQATEEYNGTTISKATYASSQKYAVGQAPPNFNFSPACALAGEHWVLGSTTQIVRQTVDALAAGSSGASPALDAQLEMNADELAAALEANQELMISQNMLSEGRSREEAEGQIGGLMSLIRMFKQASLSLDAQDKDFVLELSLGTDW